MGIDIYSAKFLCSEVKRGLKLGHMLTLGHQSVYMDPERYRRLVESRNVRCQDVIYADDFFRSLGSTSVDVMDASDYEGANILHDLNEPVHAGLIEQYDSVFDGGALEHVFNLPQALKNCMDMVKVGGHFLAISPANAFCGHGFYQFSPEMFYSALSEKNGYRIEQMVFTHRNRWYSVRKPSDVKGRIELLTYEPTLLFVSARRYERKRIFGTWPQQSDYAATWKGTQNGSNQPPSRSHFKESLLNFFPLFKKLQAVWRNYKRIRSCRPGNRALFIPVDLE